MNQQTIIFDIGGLLVQLDGVPGLTRLLGLERDAAHETWMTSASVIAHETGKIDSMEFAASFVDEHELPIPAAEFLEVEPRAINRPLGHQNHARDPIILRQLPQTRIDLVPHRSRKRVTLLRPRQRQPAELPFSAFFQKVR